MPRPTISNIEQFLNVDRAKARAIREVILDAEVYVSSPGGGGQIDNALDYINKAIEAYGVEAVRGDYHVNNYFGDIVALYVNTGDVYNGTVLYETDKGRFHVTTLGDWVERAPRKYKIQ